MKKHEILSDGQLIKLYLNGNENAFETLLLRHKNKVFTSVYFMVNDRYLAEDIFQESFIKAVKFIQAGKYTHEDKFGPWITRIAKNKAIDAIRSRKLRPTVTDSDGVSIFDFIGYEDAKAETKLIDAEKTDYVRHFIDKLPEKQKEVIILRHYADLSFKEIAKTTHTNINTCIGRMHYALANLKKMMDKNIMYTK